MIFFDDTATTEIYTRSLHDALPISHDFGEAFRALRTALVASNTGESTRIVAITSAQPLEGKTTTAVNIALALAIGGDRKSTRLNPSHANILYGVFCLIKNNIFSSAS